MFSSVPTYIYGTGIEAGKSYWENQENRELTRRSRPEYLGLPGLRNKGSSCHNDIEKLATRLLQPEQKHCNYTMASTDLAKTAGSHLFGKHTLNSYLCISKHFD